MARDCRVNHARRSRARNESRAKQIHQFLNRRFTRWPVKGDLPVLQEVESVANVENVRVVVRHKDDRDLTPLLEAAYQSKIMALSFTPIAAVGSSNSNTLASAKTERATAMACL